MIGVIVLMTAYFFVPLHIAHPVFMLFFLVMTCVTFSLLGFIIGIWADGFEKLQLIPLLIISPLTFLGGSFYSIDMLPPFWHKFSLLNPVVYLVSGFRWSFYEQSDVSIFTSITMISVYLILFIGIIRRIFTTGYGLKK
jgi:ABC-2 type transport system permease protein